MLRSKFADRPRHLNGLYATVCPHKRFGCPAEKGGRSVESLGLGWNGASWMIDGDFWRDDFENYFVF